MRTLGDLVVLVHDRENPTAAEWSAFLAELRRIDVSRARVLVRTDGAAPDSLQRQQLNDLLKGQKLPIAVLSDSALVRGVGTALRWFNPAVRVFAASALDGALEHLHLPPAQREPLRSALRELSHELASDAIGASRSGARRA